MVESYKNPSALKHLSLFFHTYQEGPLIWFEPKSTDNVEKIKWFLSKGIIGLYVSSMEYLKHSCQVSNSSLLIYLHGINRFHTSNQRWKRIGRVEWKCTVADFTFLFFLDWMPQTNNYCMINEEQIEVWLQLVRNLWCIKLWTRHIQLCKWLHPNFSHSGNQFCLIRQFLRVVFWIFVT